MGRIFRRGTIKAPFRYLAEKNVVRISLYEDSVHDDISGSHASYNLQPSKDFLGLTFDELKSAGAGLLDIDEDAKTAQMIQTFDN